MHLMHPLNSHHHATVTLDHHPAKKSTDFNNYEDDDTSAESDDGFSDVSSVDSLPSDLKNRYIEFNTGKS